MSQLASNSETHGAATPPESAIDGRAKPLSRSRRWVFILAILLTVSLVTLVGAELILRFQESLDFEQLATQEADSPLVESDIPSLHYRLKPGYVKGRHTFNSLGFNMEEKDGEKRASLHRIVFVGDSATQGTGTEETSQAFPNRVDQLLQKQSELGVEFEAWNCGVGGYNVDQVLAMVRNVVPALQPDVCVYYLNFNDCWPPSIYENGQAVIRPPDARSDTGLRETIKSLRVVSLAIDWHRNLHHAWSGYAPTYVDSKIHFRSWSKMKSVILQMREHCSDHGVAFLVGIHPREQFLYRPDEDNLALQDVRRFLEEEEIVYLDLQPVLKEYREEVIYLQDGDHCTARGYSIIADAFFEWFDQLQLNAPVKR